MENRPSEICHLQGLNPERDPRQRPLSLLWHGASGMLTAPAYKRNVSAHRLHTKLLEMVSAFHLRLPFSRLQDPTNVTGPVLRAFPERMGCRLARRRMLLRGARTQDGPVGVFLGRVQWLRFRGGNDPQSFVNSPERGLLLLLSFVVQIDKEINSWGQSRKLEFGDCTGGSVVKSI